MLSRWHIFYGSIFSLSIWLIVPQLKWYYVLFIFLSSFLINLDHYLYYLIKTKKIRLANYFDYRKKRILKEKEENKKGIKTKGDLHIFHTLEFHILVGILSIFWMSFFYILIGMIFHSLLDIIYLVYNGLIYRREFFMTKWLYKKMFMFI